MLSVAIPYNECTYKRASRRKNCFLVLSTCEIVSRPIGINLKLALLEENQTLMTLQQKTIKSGVDGCHKTINCTIT